MQVAIYQLVIFPTCHLHHTPPHLVNKQTNLFRIKEGIISIPIHTCKTLCIQFGIQAIYQLAIFPIAPAFITSLLIQRRFVVSVN